MKLEEKTTELINKSKNKELKDLQEYIELTSDVENIIKEYVNELLSTQDPTVKKNLFVELESWFYQYKDYMDVCQELQGSLKEKGIEEGVIFNEFEEQHFKDIIVLIQQIVLYNELLAHLDPSENKIEAQIINLHNIQEKINLYYQKLFQVDTNLISKDSLPAKKDINMSIEEYQQMVANFFQERKSKQNFKEYILSFMDRDIFKKMATTPIEEMKELQEEPTEEVKEVNNEEVIYPFQETQNSTVKEIVFDNDTEVLGNLQTQEVTPIEPTVTYQEEEKSKPEEVFDLSEEPQSPVPEEITFDKDPEILESSQKEETSSVEEPAIVDQEPEPMPKQEENLSFAPLVIEPIKEEPLAIDEAEINNIEPTSISEDPEITNRKAMIEEYKNRLYERMDRYDAIYKEMIRMIENHQSIPNYFSKEYNKTLPFQKICSKEINRLSSLTKEQIADPNFDLQIPHESLVAELGYEVKKETTKGKAFQVLHEANESLQNFFEKFKRNPYQRNYKIIDSLRKVNPLSIENMTKVANQGRGKAYKWVKSAKENLVNFYQKHPRVVLASVAVGSVALVATGNPLNIEQNYAEEPTVAIVNESDLVTDITADELAQTLATDVLEESREAENITVDENEIIPEETMPEENNTIGYDIHFGDEFTLKDNEVPIYTDMYCGLDGNQESKKTPFYPADTIRTVERIFMLVPNEGLKEVFSEEEKENYLASGASVYSVHAPDGYYKITNDSLEFLNKESLGRGL